MENRTFFSDETSYYRFPNEPDPGDPVHIRFRTGRYQASKVLLCVCGENVPMHWEYDRNDFDFYGADLTVGSETLTYYFIAEAQGKTIYFGKTGVKKKTSSVVPFVLIPGFHIPQWSKGCLYYQIFPDRFYSAFADNNQNGPDYMYGGEPVFSSKWGDPVHPHTYRQFYGGDLQGIINKIPYLKSLGIEAIYLNPVFASPSSHKYDCCDYEHVDFGLGVQGDEEASNALLAELIRTAHDNGMKVVLDGVFNHCSFYHKWFDRNRKAQYRTPMTGAYKNKDSIFHNRFTFYDESCSDYESWWNVPSLPKLNYEGDSSLMEEILSIAKKWISPPYNADGWRLDVAADLGHSVQYNHEFWIEFRKAVRSVNEDALIIAEHYEDPSTWLSGDQWDGIMNYTAFMEPVSYFFTGMEKHSDYYVPELKGDAEEFERRITNESAKLPQNSLLSSLTQLDNHDHSRFLTRTNHLVGRVEKLGSKAAEEDTDLSVFRSAAAFLYFWQGSPGLYYGDEAGVCGFTDPDNRRCYPWDSPDHETIEYFGELADIRKDLSFIKTASCRILYAKNEIVSFARFTDKQALILVFSASEESANVKIPIWIAGIPGYEEERILTCLLISDENGYSFQKKPFIAHYGILEIPVLPRSAQIFDAGTF